MYGRAALALCLPGSIPDHSLITPRADSYLYHIFLRQEMEKLVDAGLVRSLGVSNFNSAQLQQLWDNCRVKPSVLQIELHPYNKNQQLVDFAKGLGLAVTAYSPLGSPDSTP